MTTQSQRYDIDVPATSGGGAFYPDDVYLAEFSDFTGPDDLPEEAQTYGPAVRLQYTFLEGEYAGEKIDELCTIAGGPRAKLRQRVETLRGSSYEGQSIQLVPLLGKRIKLVLKANDKGFSKIESTLAVAAPRAAGATAPAPAAAARPTPARKF